MPDDRLVFPACARNRGPILAVLRDVFANTRSVLEVGCGSGEHAAHFAAAMPDLEWIPTDVEAAHVASARAWTAAIPNVRPAFLFDVTTDGWPVHATAGKAGAIQVDGVFSANVIHIAPWDVAVALFRSAAANLPPGGRLVTYGPYRFGGEIVASNAAFDESLRQRNPAWGVRDVDDLASIGGLRLERTFPMPANNHLLVWAAPTI